MGFSQYGNFDICFCLFFLDANKIIEIIKEQFLKFIQLSNVALLDYTEHAQLLAVIKQVWIDEILYIIFDYPIFTAL